MEFFGIKRNGSTDVLSVLFLFIKGVTRVILHGDIKSAKNKVLKGKKINA